MKSPRPPWLLVLAVLGLHLLAGQEVQRIQEGWASDGESAMPARMQVEFVREMVMQAPSVSVRAVEPPAAALDGRGAAPPVALPASAPQTLPPPPPLPMPDLPPLPDVVAQTASAPAQVGPPVARAASAPSSDEPGPEWPLSTRLTYTLSGHYRGPVSGTAQVEWMRQGSSYQVHLDVDLGLVSRRMSSQGRLTPDGIAPERYDEETRVLGFSRDPLKVFFLAADVQLASGVRRPLARGAQDAASQFVQLTWLFLTGREPMQAGRVVTFPLALPRRLYDWQYEVVGEAVLQTPMGPVASWHLRPSAAARQGVSGGDMVAEVWLAPSLQYLPLRLVIRQDEQTYIDLMLKSAPLQAAPESANDTPRR
ncbi:DUF3108 domain-containing protein [Roseateles sp. DC23W]|uniref:DUF3108 domain-containing protein n=1 Tax=Pelomonas dachongensis TaxID=3299029 RepID=A0ABW7EPG6_9BURK